MPGLTAPERQMYADFVSEFGCSCWACEFQPLPALDSISFNPIERHHIVGGSSREHDRRLIANLCKVHHMLTHGETIRANNGQPLPKLSLQNILWLKLIFDADHYDPEYIRARRIKRAEELKPEPVIYNVYEA